MRSSTTGPATTQASPAASSTAGLATNAWTNFLPTAIAFATDQGAALVIDPSAQGDGGTIYVAGAVVPRPWKVDPATLPAVPPVATATVNPSGSASDVATRPRAWATDVPAMVPQVTLETEQFNRLVRMADLGENLRIAVDLRTTFYPPERTRPANTIAEIPGSDLKDQIVLVGAHLDSWHSGTGATDNGVGATAAMEAVRILRHLNLHPRRTIRVALWTGEEQGLLGSTSYVKQHMGHFPDPAPTTRPDSLPATRPIKDVIRGPEYEQLSIYFNLDNGTGKIRGVYAQGNAHAGPYFQKWLKPFSDLGASTVSLANTGSTDHIPFDNIGLPGFQFIQDPIEYRTRTHHSNADVLERVQFDDLKQASTIMAAFLWDAADVDERFPRKP
jgi:peptidoglycan hydrolase-like protein with peptidoglycan-binding domain